MAKIDHVAYSWGMIELQAADLGEDVFVNCTSISWNAARTVETNYGLGGQPCSRGFGNVEYSANITLDVGTMIMLRNLASNETKTLMGLGQFSIIVSWWVDMMQNLTEETTTLADCFFSEDGMEANQNDTNITKQYDLHPYRIFTDASAQTNRSAELYAGGVTATT